MGALIPETGTRPPEGRHERIAFLTGKLAAPSLRSVLEGLAPRAGFDAEVLVLNIAVAALMTAEWAARRVSVPQGTTKLIVPGHVAGDLRAIEAASGVPVERGPKDLRELPRLFGEGAAAGRGGYGAHDIEIIAEVNHVPRLPRDAVLAAARKLRADGADVIDLGCDPGGPFTGIADLVKALRDDGHRVSVDSLDPAEIVPAARAGAELVLSVNASNIACARDLGCEVVVIPDDIPTLGGLERSVETLAAWGVKHRIDPVIEPIGFGFARSLGRYLAVRDRFPSSEALMGIGNITELTDADSAAINVLLLGFCQELGVRSVLTTEVIHWARTSTREVDLARRLVHFAVTQRRLPKHLEPALHLLRDAEVLRHGPEALEALARGIRDKSFRIFAEDGRLHVMSSEGHWQGEDPFDLFEELGPVEPSHAFYLGYEMAKAVTALTLGKNYVQDEALRWGYLTLEEESHQKKGRKPHDR